MAQEIVIDISAESTKAINSLSKIEEKLFKISEQEEKLKELISKTKDVEKLKAYKNELNKLKEVQKAYIKRQAEIKKSNDVAFGKLDSVLGGLPSKLKDSVGAVKTLSRGFGTLRTAVAATGIGALVIAVTAAVEWFSNFDAAVKITSKVMDGIAGAVNQLGKALDLLLKGDFSGAADAFTDIGNAALQAAENADKLFETTKALQELQARNIPINAKLRQDLELQKKILEDTTLAENERLKALEEVTRISSIIQQNAIEENKLKAQELELKIANENSDEKRRELQIELARVQAELIDQEGQLNIIRKDAEKVEREIIALTRAKRNEQIKEELRTQQELNNELKRKQELLAKAKEQDAATRITKAVDEEKMRGLAVNQQALKNAGMQIKIEEDAAEKRRKLAQQDLDFKIQNTTNGLNAILALNSIFQGKTTEQQKKAFKRTKALNIAAALTETYLSAQKAYTSQIIPLDPTSVVRGVLAAAASVAAGLARVAQIRRTNFSPSSEGPTPSIGGNIGSGNFTGGSGFNPLTPSIVSPTGVQDVNVVNAQSGVRAYVVENDITNSQALTKTLNRRSRL